MSEVGDTGAPWHVVATRAEILRLLDRFAAIDAQTISFEWLYGLDPDVRRRYRAAWRYGHEALDGALPLRAPTLLLPPGPLAAADEPFLDDAVARALGAPGMTSQLLLLRVLRRHPSAHALGLMGGLIERTRWSIVDARGRSQRREACTEQGLDPRADEPARRTSFAEEEEDEDFDDDE